MIELLYTAEEIAEKYGGKNKNITTYTVTQQWVKKGLKHIRGKGKAYLFKIEWVEQFLEEQAIIDQDKDKNAKFNISKNKNTSKRLYVV